MHCLTLLVADYACVTHYCGTHNRVPHSRVPQYTLLVTNYCVTHYCVTHYCVIHYAPCSVAVFKETRLQFVTRVPQRSKLFVITSCFIIFGAFLFVDEVSEDNAFVKIENKVENGDDEEEVVADSDKPPVVERQIEMTGDETSDQ